MDLYIVPKGTLVDVCSANDELRDWKEHTMSKTMIGDLVHQDSGAVVIRVGQHLILARKEKCLIGSYPNQ